jgi:hypothetical protein
MHQEAKDSLVEVQRPKIPLKKEEESHGGSGQ